MNLNWNGTYNRFEAEFSADFQGDLAAVKAAGFKTEGPPGWVWHSYKAEPLTKLRENRPQSGLTITPEAREQFTALVTVEAKNAEMKAQLAAHNKELKKKLKIEEQEGKAFIIPAKGYIDASDLSPCEIKYTPYVRLPWTGPLCSICSAPLLPFELHDPNICMYCEKTVIDDFTEVC